MGSVQTFSGGFYFVWGWGWGEEAMLEDLSLEESVMGKEKFNDKGAGFSSITIRKQWKINMKRFFKWKEEVALKLKMNRDYYPYEGF